MRGNTKKSPIKLSAAKIKLTQWFVYEWRKLIRQKPHRVILRSSLPKIHYYQNKRLQVKESQYLISTYSWTLTPIPNWTCSVVTISPFDARLPSTWLTNCMDPSTWLQSQTREGCWLQRSSVHPNDEDHEDAWSQNPTVHKHSNFFKNDELWQILSLVTIYLNKLCSTFMQLVNTLTTLKIIILYV